MKRIVINLFSKNIRTLIAKSICFCFLLFSLVPQSYFLFHSHPQSENYHDHNTSEFVNNKNGPDDESDFHTHFAEGSVGHEQAQVDVEKIIEPTAQVRRSSLEYGSHFDHEKQVLSRISGRTILSSHRHSAARHRDSQNDQYPTMASAHEHKHGHYLDLSFHLVSRQHVVLAPTDQVREFYLIPQSQRYFFAFAFHFCRGPPVLI